MITRITSICRHHDWVADALLLAIPFMLLSACVVALFAYANDWLNPPLVRRWFSDRLVIPHVMLYAGFIPWYKPFDRWDAVA